MGFWQDNLKHRIPEYYETGEDLVSYLDVCGEVFDEISDTVRAIDDYKDYKKCPESRLSLLSYRFNFNPPASIPESLMRGICRDVAFINRTNGTIGAIKWVFKLLNWDVDYKFAWLPAPEKFEPKLREAYAPEYLGETEDELNIGGYFIPKMGQPYRMGVEDQAYHNDPAGTISGQMKMGSNGISYANPNQQFTPTAIAALSTDAGKISANNFLYGEAVVRPTGTYLSGKTLYGADGSEEDYRILGENYDEYVNRTNVKVMATPYLLIQINEQDYFKFTAPYIGSDGETYEYTDGESFRTTQILINYLLHQYVRPSNVRILSIATSLSESDELSEEDIFQQVITVNPDIFADDVGVSENIDETVTVDASQYPLEYGNTHYTYGAPTAQPINSLSAVTPPTYGDSQLVGTPILGITEFDVMHTLDIDIVI